MDKKYYKIDNYELEHFDDNKAFLPDNIVVLLPQFQKDNIPVFDGNVLTFKKELDLVEIPNCYYGNIVQPQSLHQNCYEDLVPIIAFSYQILVECPNIILSIIELFKNHFKLERNDVKFKIAVKKKNGNKVIVKYNGPVCGIDSLKELAKELK